VNIGNGGGKEKETKRIQQLTGGGQLMTTTVSSADAFTAPRCTLSDPVPRPSTISWIFDGQP
jgi:hypothetical protein